MVQNAFSDIVLTTNEVRILRKLCRGAVIPLDTNNPSHIGLDSHRLIEEAAVRERDTDGYPIGVRFVTASDKGRRYLIYRREDMFRHRWPVYLSIAALLIAIVSLVAQVASRLPQLPG